MTIPPAPEAAPPVAKAEASGTEIAALVLAFVLPVVGLVLALVARADRRRRGLAGSGLVAAALIISAVLTALGVLATIAIVVVAVVLPNAQSGWDSPPPPGEPVSEIVLRAQHTDGTALDDDELGLSREAISYRLERVGVPSSGFYLAEGQIHVMFNPSVTADEVERAADTLGGDFRTDFRPVLEATDTCDPSIDHSDPSAGQEVTLCDADGFQYVLAPSAISGERISDATAGTVTNSQGVSTGVWAVNIAFDAEGTAQLTEMTEQLYAFLSSDPTRNRFAIVLDGEVLSAPTVQGVITDGNPQISGSLDGAASRRLANLLKLSSVGLTLRVDSVSALGG